MSKFFGHILNVLGVSRSGHRSSFCKSSYSQCGEDLIVRYIFQLRGIDIPTYLDIGANDPFYLSNTALFYLNGSTGINIEPDPSLIKKFFDYRPRDINLAIGIGAETCEKDLYIMDDPALNSFLIEEVRKYESLSLHKLVETRKILVSTVNSVLQEYNNGVFPDFLSLDAEGMDFEILKSIDYNSDIPKVICVEAAEYSPTGAGEKRIELIDFLISKGYFEYASTNLNVIMVKKEFWYR